ncbi:MAG: type I phosphomannose isomerase catalytic subunit [Planctomycetota bacterium]|nr:type I phosphomannose isomerase catalytic subunit [Planctomycetota bacterium]
MAPLYPLCFQPILRRYLWGGRRLGTVLGKSIGPGCDYAESWEVADHGIDQSVVTDGPLAGKRLGQLVEEFGVALTGGKSGFRRFPLLLKYLDAHRVLSVQVHPNDTQAALLQPPDLGKTEAWVILAADPGSVIYAGLRSGVRRADLEVAVGAGRVAELLHVIEPSVGDCYFIPAGTVHALGAGLLIAEIQQSSDVTFRLFDWNRRGPDGMSRRLDVDAALNAIDFSMGPVACRRPEVIRPSVVSRLVSCSAFSLDRWTWRGAESLGGDGRFHLVTVLEGEVTLIAKHSQVELQCGQTSLIPACCQVQMCAADTSVMLDAHISE